MNQVQRKFLIDRITEKIKLSIKSLETSKLEKPSASNYIFRALLNNELNIREKEHIKEALKNKALKAKEGKNWLTNETGLFSSKENIISIEISDLIIIPEDYKKELDRVIEFNNEINSKIRDLSIQLESIEVRIQLASDKTLQRLINDVDDMGDISLIDTKIKLLN